jgi:hypothetical protein
MIAFVDDVGLLFKYSETRLKRTARDRPFLLAITGVRYNRVHMCTDITKIWSL